MAITVTATQGGTGTDNGIALTVKVLTGAASAAAQNGATGSDDTTLTTPQKAITPNATGSIIYGAVTMPFASTFTPNGSTTFSQNVSDSTNTEAYGTFRSTSTTTAAIPVTVGGSAPTETAGDFNWAAAEILAAATLAEDISSPAGVNTKTATTVTTASFAPPAGSLLVAMVASDYSGTGTLTMTVSGGTLTWVQLAGETLNLASVWIAQVPAAVIALLLAPLIPPGPFSPMAYQSAPPPQPPSPLVDSSVDAGSGADTGSVTAAASDTDTGSGADTGSETPGATGADSGSGADTGSITGVTTSDTDTGTGADVATVTAPVSGADTGSGAESGGQLAKSADTGSAAESATAGPYIAPFRPTSVLWNAPDKLSKSGGSMP